jgi:hypothetical protein
VQPAKLANLDEEFVLVLALEGPKADVLQASSLRQARKQTPTRISTCTRCSKRLHTGNVKQQFKTVSG